MCIRDSFCVAVNLLELQTVLKEIDRKPDMETLTLKEKSAFVAGLLGIGSTTYHPVKTNLNITMKKSVLLLLLSALFTYGSVYAQLRVTGTVRDAATSEPMAGALSLIHI